MLIYINLAKNSNYGVASNCRYFLRSSLKPAEKSAKNKLCTNRPKQS